MQVGVYHPAWRLGCSYAYLMGTTGAAFRLNWHPGWHGDNVATFLVSDDPSEVFRRAFESIGYACEMVCRAELRQEGRDTEDYLRSRIIESIRDRGRPVIAHGVVGPPEECIITGYDEHGDVLIGWNFFQDAPDCNVGVEFEPSGYFRKRHWFDETWGLLLIGDKQEPPPLGQVYREALRWALKVVRTPATYGDRHSGLAAYEAWAEHLLRDEEFSMDDMDVLRERMMVHDDAVGTVAEGRWYASRFLAEMAGCEGDMAPELLAAASCYAAEHELMWKIWGCVGGLGRSDEQVRRLAEPEVRRKIVPLILQSREKDAEAADHLERALEK
jgi:hypothetical protein